MKTFVKRLVRPAACIYSASLLLSALTVYAGPPGALGPNGVCGNDGTLATSVEGEKSYYCASRKIDDVLQSVKDDPKLMNEIEDAFKQSNPGKKAWDAKTNPNGAREQGGFILQCRTGPEGAYSYHTEIRRLPPGGAACTDNIKPDLKSGGKECHTAATFHTHPGSKDAGDFWNHKPSPDDVVNSGQLGVPGFIIYGGKPTDMNYATYGASVRKHDPIAGIITANETRHDRVETDENGDKHYLFNSDEATLYTGDPRTTHAKWPTDFKECPADNPYPLTAKGSCFDGDTSSPGELILTNDSSETRTYSIAMDSGAGVPTKTDGSLAPGETETIQVFPICPPQACTCGSTVVTSDLEVEWTIPKLDVRGTDNHKMYTKCSPPPCNSSGGDPHLHADGLRYDFHSIGDFLLARSADDDFEVHVRQQRYSDRISINTAAIVRVGQHHVGIYTDPDSTVLKLLVDGEQAEIEVDQQHAVGDVGYITRVGNRINVYFNDGYIFLVRRGGYPLLNISLRAPPGKELQGLLGDTGGKQLIASSGQTFESPVSFDDLYKAFGESWRLSPQDSMFDDEPAEVRSGYTAAGLPKSPRWLNELPAPDLQRARVVCEAAGIIHPIDLRDCLLDVVIMGLDEFSPHRPPADTSTRLLALAPSHTNTETVPYLKHEPVAAVGSSLDVKWAGPNQMGDLVVVTEKNAAESQWYSYVLADVPALTSLKLPNEAGDYEVRYLSSTKNVLARSELKLVNGQATVQIPSSVRAGASFEVSWDGPDEEKDYVAVTTVEKFSKRPNNSWKYVRNYLEDDTPLELRAPDEPGRYQIHYISEVLGESLGQANFLVTPVTAGIDAPLKAVAGSDIALTWQGEGFERDYLTIVKPEMPAGSYTHWIWATGNIGKLFAPEKPGDYEIRYVTGQANKILARSPITILPVEASIKAPDRVEAGSQLEVRWTGPAYRRDFITIVPRSAPDSTYASFKYPQYAEGGPAPVMLTAPDENCDCEIRYVSGGERHIWARQAIEVRQ